MLRNLLIFIFLLVIAPCSHSDILVNLYESEVVVSDRDDLTFERAARAGLLKVLVKLSGDSAVFEKSQLDQIFGPAKCWLFVMDIFKKIAVYSASKLPLIKKPYFAKRWLQGSLYGQQIGLL